LEFPKASQALKRMLVMEVNFTPVRGGILACLLVILYIILAVILMAVAILWQSVLRGRMEELMAFHH